MHSWGKISCSLSSSPFPSLRSQRSHTACAHRSCCIQIQAAELGCMECSTRVLHFLFQESKNVIYTGFEQNNYWVKLQTLSTIQPHAHVQILRDMTLHPGPTEWAIDLSLGDQNSSSDISFSAALETPDNSSLNFTPQISNKSLPHENNHNPTKQLSLTHHLKRVCINIHNTYIHITWHLT